MIKCSSLSGRTVRTLWISQCAAIVCVVVCMGCGGNVTGPVRPQEMSTEKVSYERKPGPELQQVMLGKIALPDKQTPVALIVPATMVHDYEIVFRGTVHWPREWGKLNIIHLEFFVFNQQMNSDMTLNETFGKITEKDDLIHFETEVIKTPARFVGPCKIKIWGSVIPASYDAKSGAPPESEHVVLGIADVEVR